MGQSWAEKKCKPCAGGTPPLSRAVAASALKTLPAWRLGSTAGSIETEYLMKDFAAAVGLINEIMKVAESEDHHPDLHLTGYRKLKIELSTHSIGGLSDNDLIMAAKIDRLPKKLKT